MDICGVAGILFLPITVTPNFWDLGILLSALVHSDFGFM